MNIWVGLCDEIKSRKDLREQILDIVYKNIQELIKSDNILLKVKSYMVFKHYFELIIEIDMQNCSNENLFENLLKLTLSKDHSLANLTQNPNEVKHRDCNKNKNEEIMELVK